MGGLKIMKIVILNNNKMYTEEYFIMGVDKKACFSCSLWDDDLPIADHYWESDKSFLSLEKTTDSRQDLCEICSKEFSINTPENINYNKTEIRCTYGIKDCSGTGDKFIIDCMVNCVNTLLDYYSDKFKISEGYFLSYNNTFGKKIPYDTTILFFTQRTDVFIRTIYHKSSFDFELHLMYLSYPYILFILTETKNILTLKLEENRSISY